MALSIFSCIKGKTILKIPRKNKMVLAIKWLTTSSSTNICCLCPMLWAMHYWKKLQICKEGQGLGISISVESAAWKPLSETVSHTDFHLKAKISRGFLSFEVLLIFQPFNILWSNSTINALDVKLIFDGRIKI